MTFVFAILMAWLQLAGASPEQTSAFRFKVEGLDASLDCSEYPCAEVLPKASRFEQVPDTPYLAGFDAAGEPVGWVVRSTDATHRKGYSSKPIVTMVGVDPEGRITKAIVVYHSEPILLVGIPESSLITWMDQYTGRKVTDPLTVGGSGEFGIDVITSATVTVLAENATILESARSLAAAMGVIEGGISVPGHFVPDDDPWTWREIERSGALGRLTVTQEQMGLTGDAPFVDLWFGLVDLPQIGIPLLGERNWRYAHDHLEDGEHLLAVFNSGTDTFRGSGFVRGGIFDRFRIEQDLGTVMFTDMDYKRLSRPELDGVPEFSEAGLFVIRKALFDPGRSFDFVFLGNTWVDRDGKLVREYHSFETRYRLPSSLYVLDGPDPEEPLWVTAWRVGSWKLAIAGTWLACIAAIFIGRRFSTGIGHERLRKLHVGFLIVTFLVLGVYLSAQPSITQLLTIASSLIHGWRWELFLSDPLVFVSWIFIAITLVIWGRGVFCGWACPYGALSELLFKVGRLLHLPEFELSEALHSRLRFLRYGVLVTLLGVFLYQSELGEMLAEIEPFKTTFFVTPWTRHWPLVVWWVVLLGASLVWYRPFCRYLCPLGAALALPSSFRISGPYRRDFCTKCKICTRTCEPRAIRPDGSIDPRECLSCMECESNWRDDTVCPPLVKERRVRERQVSSGVSGLEVGK